MSFCQVGQLLYFFVFVLSAIPRPLAIDAASERKHRDNDGGFSGSFS